MIRKDNDDRLGVGEIGNRLAEELGGVRWREVSERCRQHEENSRQAMPRVFGAQQPGYEPAWILDVGDDRGNLDRYRALDAAQVDLEPHGLSSRDARPTRARCDALDDEQPKTTWARARQLLGHRRRRAVINYFGAKRLVGPTSRGSTKPSSGAWTIEFETSSLTSSATESTRSAGCMARAPRVAERANPGADDVGSRSISIRRVIGTNSAGGFEVAASPSEKQTTLGGLRSRRELGELGFRGGQLLVRGAGSARTVPPGGARTLALNRFGSNGLQM